MSLVSHHLAAFLTCMQRTLSPNPSQRHSLAVWVVWVEVPSLLTAIHRLWGSELCSRLARRSRRNRGSRSAAPPELWIPTIAVIDPGL